MLKTTTRQEGRAIATSDGEPPHSKRKPGPMGIGRGQLKPQTLSRWQQSWNCERCTTMTSLQPRWGVKIMSLWMRTRLVVFI